MQMQGGRVPPRYRAQMSSAFCGSKTTKHAAPAGLPYFKHAATAELPAYLIGAKTWFTRKSAMTSLTVHSGAPKVRRNLARGEGLAEPLVIDRQDWISRN